jgi:uncharacterized protein
VTQDTLISNWQVEENTEWTLSALSPLIALKPKIILLGQTKVLALPPRVIAHLQAQKIGIEAMSLGAACRTFNILLQEGRMVCLGILLAFSGKAPIA